MKNFLKYSSVSLIGLQQFHCDTKENHDQAKKLETKIEGINPENKHKIIEKSKDENDRENIKKLYSKSKKNRGSKIIKVLVLDLFQDFCVQIDDKIIPSIINVCSTNGFEELENLCKCIKENQKLLEDLRKKSINQKNLLAISDQKGYVDFCNLMDYLREKQTQEDIQFIMESFRVSKFSSLSSICRRRGFNSFKYLINYLKDEQVQKDIKIILGTFKELKFSSLSSICATQGSKNFYELISYLNNSKVQLGVNSIIDIFSTKESKKERFSFLASLVSGRGSAYFIELVNYFMEEGLHKVKSLPADKIIIVSNLLKTSLCSSIIDIKKLIETFQSSNRPNTTSYDNQYDSNEAEEKNSSYNYIQMDREYFEVCSNEKFENEFEKKNSDYSNIEIERGFFDIYNIPNIENNYCFDDDDKSIQGFFLRE